MSEYLIFIIRASFICIYFYDLYVTFSYFIHFIIPLLYFFVPELHLSLLHPSLDEIFSSNLLHCTFDSSHLSSIHTDFEGVV